MDMIFSRLFSQRFVQYWSTRVPPVWKQARSVNAALQVRLSESQPNLGSSIIGSSTTVHLSIQLCPELAQRLIAHYQNDPQKTQALVRILESIDFAPLVRKLWSAQFPYCWSRSRTAQAVKSYACFLLDAALQPDEPLPAVSGDMDQLWHCHILQTQKYTGDCVALFGHYLHHDVIVPSLSPSADGACKIGISRNPVTAMTDTGGCTIGRSVRALRPI